MAEQPDNKLVTAPLNTNRAAIQAAQAALAAGRKGNTSCVISHLHEALSAGLAAAAAAPLLRWMAQQVDLVAALRLIRAFPNHETGLDVLDPLFQAAFLTDAIAHPEATAAAFIAIMEKRLISSTHWLPNNVREIQHQAAAQGWPTVAIFTLPKSGTLFLRAAIEEFTPLPGLPLSIRLFPQDWIIPSYLSQIAQGGCYLSEHLDGRAENLTALASAGITRLYVQIRDPRQALISWVYHVVKGWGDIYQIGRVDAAADYPTLPLSDQIDYMIDHHYPRCLTWIQGWVTAQAEAEKWGLDILIKDYGDLQTDPLQTIKDLFAYFMIIPQKNLRLPKLEPGMAHFRRGDPDEWRKLCNKNQQKRLNSALPETLRQRFDWRK